MVGCVMAVHTGDRQGRFEIAYIFLEREREREREGEREWLKQYVVKDCKWS